MKKFVIVISFFFCTLLNCDGQSFISNLLYIQAMKEYINKDKMAGLTYSEMYFDFFDIKFECTDSLEGVKIIAINSFDLDSLLIDNNIIIYKLWPIEINQKNETLISITKYSCERVGEFNYKSVVINTLEVYFEYICKQKRYLLRHSSFR